MNRGILIFAHNSTDIDYAKLSLISGYLASKNLGLPVSLVVDSFTISWMQESNLYKIADKIFDQIIEFNNPDRSNTRKIFDGTNSKIVPFFNYTRADAYIVTPYEHTLLIDSDFLIFSDTLNQYWESDSNLMIADGIKDIYKQERLGYQYKWVSDTGIHIFWATTVMFRKNKKTSIYFQLVDHIRKNYRYYSDLYRFRSNQYRNDYSFSIAKHILDGFETSDQPNLPCIITLLDKDILYSVADDHKLNLLINSDNDRYFLVSSRGVDLHIMNKQSIIRNAERFLDL